MFRLSGVVLLALVLSEPAMAEFLNGGFEGELPGGWSLAGDGSRQEAGFGVGPTEGQWQLLLTTKSELVDFGTFSGVDAVGAVELESFLELSGGALDTLDGRGGGAAVEGSAVRQSFAARQGDTLWFDYNFLTEETEENAANNDLAFVSISGGLTSVLELLADTFDPDLALSAAVLDLSTYETGYRTGTRSYRFVAPADGVYTLALGVLDIAQDPFLGGEFTPSGLLVDGVRLETSSEPGPNPIPVPPSVVLLATGLLSAWGVRGGVVAFASFLPF